MSRYRFESCILQTSLTKPDFYLSRWSNSKIGYPYLPAHDPGGGVPAAGGPARVACPAFAPLFVRHLPCQGRLPGFAGSRRPQQSFVRVTGWTRILHGLVACQAPPRVVRRACPAKPSPPLPPGSATSDPCFCQGPPCRSPPGLLTVPRQGRLRDPESPARPPRESPASFAAVLYGPAPHHAVCHCGVDGQARRPCFASRGLPAVLLGHRTPRARLARQLRHDPGGGGSPAELLRRFLFGICPVRVVCQASPAPGVRSSLLSGSPTEPTSSTAWSPAKPHCPTIVRRTCPTKPSPPLPAGGPKSSAPPKSSDPCFCQGPPCRSPPGRPPGTALPGCAPCFWQGRSRDSGPCEGRPPASPAGLRSRPLLCRVVRLLPAVLLGHRTLRAKLAGPPQPTTRSSALIRRGGPDASLTGQCPAKEANSSRFLSVLLCEGAMRPAPCFCQGPHQVVSRPRRPSASQLARRPRDPPYLAGQVCAVLLPVPRQGRPPDPGQPRQGRPSCFFSHKPLPRRVVPCCCLRHPRPLPRCVLLPKTGQPRQGCPPGSARRGSVSRERGQFKPVPFVVLFCEGPMTPVQATAPQDVS